MKAILLHVHRDAGQDDRLNVAIDLARLVSGRIRCVQIAADMAEADREHDRLARHAIESSLRRAATVWDWRCCDGSAAVRLIEHSQLADIVVTSQAQRPELTPDLAIISDLVMHGRAPVMVVPAGCRRFEAHGAAVLAWNGSAAAAQAMRQAVPLLRRAACVHIVEVSGGGPGVPASEAALYLARYGATTEVHEWPAKNRSPSAALAHAVAELDARYLVMGAFGRRTGLGQLGDHPAHGVTRDLIETSTVPLLMTH
ncbi:hypothetical protein [Sandarakinorhabdus sp.]|uniref:hypothetical protein n=1 Tax=Sandarakinorhabdus sp. TaxID=1916663 RepID=UPI00286E6707|nr:hypothetical protein [Sandarakinorhabdus sp.]